MHAHPASRQRSSNQPEESMSNVHVRYSLCRRLSVCLSVTFVHPIERIEIFGNVSMPFGMLEIC